MSSALAEGLDLATQDMCNAAGIMVAVADEFPPCIAIGRIMPLGVGGPGSLAEGASNWLAGADAMQQAQQTLTSACSALGADQWTGGDRDAFDQQISDFAAQLGDSHNYAMAVGATLAGLSAPMAAYGPVCLGIGGIMLAEAIAFDAAVASIVGNLGASEAIYAEAVGVASACLAVLIGWNATMTALLTTAAGVIGIADAVDIAAQMKNGDQTILDDFAKAQVAGLGEAAENVESWGVGLAANYAGDKVGGSLEGSVGTGLAGKALRAEIGSVVGNQINNDNSGLIDLATGQDPVKTITDTLGVTPQVDIAEHGIKAAEDLPENLAELINEGVNWRDHSGS